MMLVGTYEKDVFSETAKAVIVLPAWRWYILPARPRSLFEVAHQGGPGARRLQRRDGRGGGEGEHRGLHAAGAA